MTSTLVSRWSIVAALLLLAATPQALTTGGDGALAPAASEASSAQQQSELSCPNAVQLRFDPGIRLQTAKQTITGGLWAGTEMSPATPCTSPTGVPYLGAIGEIRMEGFLSCSSSSMTGDARGTIDVTWDSGETSVVSWRIITYQLTPIVEAAFVSGPLTGARMFQELTPTGISGNCYDRPVTSGGYTGFAEVIGGE